MIGQRPLHSVLVLLGLGLVVLFTFSGLLSADRLPTYRDLLFFVLPFKYFLAEHLQRGEIPLWNPYIYLGTPFLASLQSAVFYPLSLLLLFPFPLGFNLFVLFHYAVALTGIWLLLRDRDLGLAASAVGSLTFVIGGYLVSMLNVTNHLQGAVWAPWLLLVYRRYVAAPTLSRFLLLAFFLAIQLLGGSPESQLMTLFVLFAWVFFQLFGRWRAMLSCSLALAAALLLAAGLTAFQLLPTVEYIQQSVRSGPLLYATQVSSWSLEPISLLQLLLPHSATLVDSGRDEIFTIFENSPPWIASIYLGLVPLCLLIAGTVVGAERRLWSAVLVVGLVLALGRHTPVLHLLYQLLPQLFGKFRFPEKFYFLVSFAAAMLAAEGAQRYLQGDAVARRLSSIAAASFVSIATIALLVRSYFPMQFLWTVMVLKARAFSADEMVPLVLDTTFKCERLLFILGTFLILGGLRRRAIIGEHAFSWLLVGLVAAELASTNRDLNLTISWDDLQSQPKVADFARIRETKRRVFHYQLTISPTNPQGKPVNGLATWFNGPPDTTVIESYKKMWAASFMNAVMVEHVSAVTEGDGIQRSSDSKLQTALEIVDLPRAVQLLRAYSTEYLIGVGSLDVDSVEKLQSVPGSPVSVYGIRDPLPLARFVSRLRSVSSELEAFNFLISPDFAVEREALVEELPDDWRNDPGEGGSAKVVEMQHDRERVRIRVKTDGQSFLVLNDSYFPGWAATIDGVETKIYRTNGLVRGLVVPTGAHAVEFRYRPASWRIGVYISLACLLGVGGVLAVSLRFPQKAAPR